MSLSSTRPLSIRPLSPLPLINMGLLIKGAPKKFSFFCQKQTRNLQKPFPITGSIRPSGCRAVSGLKHIRLLKHFSIICKRQFSLIPSVTILLNHEHFRESQRSIIFINPSPPLSGWIYLRSAATGIPRITKLSTVCWIRSMCTLAGSRTGPKYVTCEINRVLDTAMRPRSDRLNLDQHPAN